ncbi:MAG: nucleotidyltransferase family protein [bacterium]|nr:nucleotidyltransferase family protein [bacterium]
MPNRVEVLRILSERLPELKRQFPIKSLALFGSVARGDETENSDVDILVEFTEPIGFFRLGDLEDQLSELTGSKIDLVTTTGVKRQFRARILSEAIYV